MCEIWTVQGDRRLLDKVITNIHIVLKDEVHGSDVIGDDLFEEVKEIQHQKRMQVT